MADEKSIVNKNIGSYSHIVMIQLMSILWAPLPILNRPYAYRVCPY